MLDMLPTEPVFQLFMGWLNDVASLNMLPIVLTDPVLQLSMG